ncbi:uncharacterized protein RCC_08026 [Ramularia collo-cygni]|uniref:Uncharacterized protein n=1 Tax=Ramularia collo-cygni TaxID=112498 RepID=A0A2D3VBH1_9PEZI|nr:uncharacterized protein RCC_08026 [Ramularia collo-cygni]CZT22157.1 uncharacterized protein RCC_08026 [Ramularia collo-cygni]
MAKRLRSAAGRLLSSNTRGRTIAGEHLLVVRPPNSRSAANPFPFASASRKDLAGAYLPSSEDDDAIDTRGDGSPEPREVESNASSYADGITDLDNINWSAKSSRRKSRNNKGRKAKKSKEDDCGALTEVEEKEHGANLASGERAACPRSLRSSGLSTGFSA